MENIKKSVISGEFIIEIDNTGHVSVYRIYDNVIDSLREIYQTEKLEYDPTWNTRQMGNNLIKKYCTGDDNTQAIIGDYLVHRRENGSIETFRDYGKGKVTEALKEVAQKVGLKVESGWNTQQLGSKLVDFINNKPKNTYIMQEFKLDGRMTVASMKDLFKTLTGGTLRVKDGNKKADESATLASIRKESDNKSGAFALNPEMTIGDFKAKMLSDYGLKVEVGTPDDWVSVPDGITLGQLRELPKNAVKAQLEALVVGGEKQTEETDSEESDDSMPTGALNFINKIINKIGTGDSTDIDKALSSDSNLKQEGIILLYQKLSDYTADVIKKVFSAAIQYGDYCFLIVAENSKGENHCTEWTSPDYEEMIEDFSTLENDGYTENVQIFVSDGSCREYPEGYLHEHWNSDVSPADDALEWICKKGKDCLGSHFDILYWGDISVYFDYNGEIIASINPK